MLGLRFAMKVSSLVVFASFALYRFSPAADATSPQDYARRNAPFAPAASVPIETRELVRNTAVQEKRAPAAPVLDKATSALSGREAAIEMAETRAKSMQPLDVRQPEKRDAVLSPLNQRVAPIATTARAAKPPLVARYQESLTAASATNMARFPAIGAATTAKINRFVFRKNAADAAPAAGAPVTPAAGGSPVSK